MKKSRMLYPVFAMLSGVFMFVYGGIDDSPGGQMIGLIVIVIGVIGLIKSTRNSAKNFRKDQ